MDKSEERVRLALSALRVSRKIVADAAEEDGWPHPDRWALFCITMSCGITIIALICTLSIQWLLGASLSTSDAIVLYGLNACIILGCGSLPAIDAHPASSLVGKDHPFLRRLFRPIARVLSCYYYRRWWLRQEQ